MKILAPCSGGWNSTHTLLGLLTDTDHEIVAPFYRADALRPYVPSSFFDYSQTASIKIAEWLKANVRDFETPTIPIETNDENDDPIVLAHEGATPTHNLPVRDGFTVPWDGGMVLARYITHARASHRFGCEEAWISKDTQNTGTDYHIRFWPIFNAIASDVRFHIPSYIYRNAAREHLEQPIGFTSGRFQQFSELPEELQVLANNEKRCLDFYRTVVEPSGEEPAVWDARAEFIGGFGAFRDIADPATYGEPNWIDSIHDPAEYVKFRGLASDHPVRRGIDRAKENARAEEVRQI